MTGTQSTPRFQLQQKAATYLQDNLYGRDQEWTVSEAMALFAEERMAALEAENAALVAERDALRNFAAECVEELAYVQASFEACGSNMCASARGKELIGKWAALAAKPEPVETAKEGNNES